MSQSTLVHSHELAARPAAAGRPGSGVTFIPRPTPLTRLHYFDGKFLRASDLELEQRYVRQLVAFANQAGGSGVVHGFNAVWPGGDRLDLGPGLAIDPAGRTLLLLEPATLSLAELIAVSRSAGAVALTSAGPRRIGRPVFTDCEPLTEDDGGTFADGGALYAIMLCHAEALCGTEDVLGRLCAEACATSSERPFILEGVLVRAVPLRIETPLATSAAVALTGKHLRSLIASAYYADEWRRGGSLISAAGLAADAWCLGAAAQGGTCVPVGLVARAGDSTLFFDAWTLRRERIEAPPRRYWAGRMAMRPWDVFLAQVLQFQCQLAHCLDHHETPEDDPCRPAFDLLRRTSEELTQWLGGAGTEGPDDRRLASLSELRGRLADAAATLTRAPIARFLLNCGITELPAAGYLPMVPSATLTVNEQVRRMMGEGVDLRFCVVRPDFVAHALEEAQHMERISLLAGLDDPARKPQVDILVPDGEIDTSAIAAPGQGYEIDFAVLDGLDRIFAALARDQGTGGIALPVSTFVVNRPVEAVPPAAGFLRLAGAGRGEDLAGGGLAFHLAGGERHLLQAAEPGDVFEPGRGQPPAVLWMSVDVDRDPFALALHERAGITAEIVFARFEGPATNFETNLLELNLTGKLRVVDRGQSPGGDPQVTAQLVGRLDVTYTHFDFGETDRDTASKTLKILEEVRFERTAGAGDGGRVSVLLPSFRFFQPPGTAAMPLIARREWTEASRAGVTVRAGGAIAQRGNLSLLDQRENPEVARADHPAHEAAIASLQRLGTSLAEADFADPRARQLFPPAAPATADLRVRATRDWVLFHRRRTKVCGLDVPPPQVASRRYGLVHVQVANQDQRELLRQTLAAGGALQRFKPQSAGTVEFAGGLASVQTAHPLVRQAWDDRAPDGASIVLGAIASQGAALADGTTLAGARLDSLAGVLSTVTPRAAGADLEVFGTVPPDLPAVGLDGIVLYATLAPAVAEVCHTALTLKEFVPLSQLEEQVRKIGDSGFDPAMFQSFGMQQIDSVLFTAGTASFRAGAVDSLRTKFAGAPSHVPEGFSLVGLVVSQAGTSAAEHAVHGAQGGAMVSELGGLRVVREVTAGGTGPLPFGCPALTVLVGVRTAELENTPGPEAVRRRRPA